MKKRILFIGLVWPEPKSSAAGSRMMQLLSVFTDLGWEVSFASAAASSEYMADLESYDISVKEIKLNHSSFDDYIIDLQPSIVIFDRFMTEEQYGWRVAEHCPDAIRILDSEDLHFLRKARRKAIAAGLSIDSADLYTDDARREIASILRCDLTIIISRFEFEILCDQFNISPQILHYLPFLSKEISANISAGWNPFNSRTGFIFIGNFHHEPNRDAVIYLKRSIWPHFRKALPDGQIKIYGAYMPQSIVQLHSTKDGFLIVGRADDASEAIGDARVMLAPLRFGAGLKGKLLESMQLGTPSVTTRVGAEGMTGGLQWNGFITDDPVLFAAAAVELYSNEQVWKSASEKSIELHNRQFLGIKYIPDFIQKLSAISDNLQSHRQLNFIGSILRHSSNNATRYMSKWIEAKNETGI
jgi:glycosyltransferase involved in cell wall biosynthesis